MGEGGAKRRYVYTIAACKTGAAPHCSIDGTAQATVTVAVATGIAAPLWIQGPSSLPGVGCVEVGGGASHDFSIDWQSVAGATRYEVVEGDDLNGSYPNNPIIVNPTSNPTFQRLSLKRSRSGNADITYNYGVRACNATTCSEERRTAYMCLTSPGGPQSPMATTTVRYLHTDALGSPVAETDEFGTLVKRTRYEPYGAPTDGVYVNGPGFTGHVTDAATGLTYMQQRYYDPLAARFLSLDPVAADPNTGANFNRYWYANNNPYRFTDPDGRCPVCVIGVYAIGVLIFSEPANAPAPGEQGVSASPADVLSTAIPPAKVLAPLKMVVKTGEKLSQRAATREAKRQAGIPTSQQATSQSNGQAPDGTQVGRQQSFEIPKPGGGTVTRSVQVSRDTQGAHAGMPQIEAGTVKPGGQVDIAGRPRLQNEDKIRVDFDPSL